VLLVLHSCASPSRAHNGSIAAAVAIEGITIDGDLSDWPEGMTRHPIRRPEFGGDPASAADLTAHFRIGYSRVDNVLYVAVEVQDESVVVLEEGVGGWDDQDGCELFVKADHGDRVSSRRAWQYVAWGHRREVYGPGRGSYGKMGSELGAAPSSTGLQYKWRVPVCDDDGEPVGLRAGSLLSFDVAVVDYDRDGSLSWMAWGRGSTKVPFDQRRGDLLLAEKAADLGRLEGRILWRGPGIRPGRTRVELTRDASFWLTAEADAEGEFTADVPAGMYRVRVVGRDSSEKDIEIEVAPESVRQVELQVLPRSGKAAVGNDQSATVGSDLSRGAWQTFGLQDGLLSPMVTDIIQDNKGHLWLATGRGACRFDGETFAAFTSEDGLTGNTVRAIFEDSQGHLWFGSNAGVTRYDGEAFAGFTEQDGLAYDETYSIAEDRRGHLWFGTVGGATRYDGESFVTMRTEDEGAGVDGVASAPGVLCMIEDSRGHLWFGSGYWANIGGNGVSRYDGERLVRFTREDGLAGDQVFSIIEDSRGDLWFGTDRGVSRYDGERFTTLATAEDLGCPIVQDVLEDSRGHIWIATGSVGGTSGRGVSRFDGERFVSFTAADGLDDNEALCLFEDGQGYLWLGTMRSGVSRYDGGRFAVFTQADGLVDDDVRAIEEDSEANLWLGTGRGVSRYDGSGFTPFADAYELPDDDVRAIAEDSEGNLWFGTGRGASRYDGHEFVHFTVESGLADDDVRVMAADSRGYVWIGSGRGVVSRSDGLGTDVFSFGAQGRPESRVGAIVEDDGGDIWIGVGNGVSRYDIELDEQVSLTTADGLGGNAVRDLLKDGDGNIWVATENGISRYDGHQYVNFTPEDGLVYGDAVKLLEDDQGHLWIATTGGISR